MNLPSSSGFAFSALLCLIPLPAQGQTIIAAPDNTGTQVEYNGQTYRISGGTEAAANLFHSFHTFGLNAGEIAQFLAHPGLENILARVTGGDPSLINGFMEITGGSPHLYLMNPAGIVFGPEARLDVPADFIATTSDRIGFDAGGWFNATGPNDYATLIGTPNQFAFLSEQPGAIINGGQLTLGTGQNLGLYGGTVINTGSLEAPGGEITLAAVPGQNLVRLSQSGMLLSLEVPSAALKAGIKPKDLPKLLTATPSLASSALPSNPEPGHVLTTGLVLGKGIHLAAAERVKVSDPQLVRSHDGAYHGPMVTIFGDPDDPVALTFLDMTVPDYQSLLYGGRRGTTTMVVTPEASGITQITETLATSPKPVDEVHIIAEGHAGNFWLGRDFISGENLAKYEAELASWRGMLSESANLLLYSCFAALGEVGEALVQGLADLTGADVAASTNATGSAALGGDWLLEASTGPITAALALTPEVMANYRERLALFTVTTGDDAGAGSLREAIVDANALAGADEIRFDGVTLINLASELVITDALTITGQGTNVTIQGNNTFRIFNVTANVPTTFEFLTITGGNAGADDNNGGGIRSIGAVTLTNTMVSGNVAGNHGGGIRSEGPLMVTNSTISGNVSGVGGGGIWGEGTVAITNSMISNNQAGNNGGGIRSEGLLTVTNSAISGNSSGNIGGGLFNVTGLIIDNSTITDNWADYAGGGIHSGPGAVTVTNSTISNNTAATGDGGGLNNATGNVTIADSMISNNSAGNNGGGLRHFGVLTLTNTTISGNTAQGGGGMRNAGAVTMNDSIIRDNVANLSGGGLLITDHPLTVNNSQINNNAAGTQGGGIRTLNSATITNTTITGNTAIAGGGGGIIGDGALTVENSTFTHNVAEGTGGAIRSSGGLTVSDSVFFDNRAAQGGAIHSPVGGTVLSGSTISGNTALTGNGGGILNAYSGVVVTNSTISNNYAGLNGGGIRSLSFINLTNTTISGNSAANRGGAIWGNNGGTILNSTLANNTVINGDGGGIFRQGGAFTIRNSIIATNRDLGGATHDLGGNFAGSTFEFNVIGTTAGATNVNLGAGNIITTDPGLVALGDYGGPTQTHALMPTSVALNGGNNAFAPGGADQRGVARIQQGTVDIGAYESAGFDLTMIEGNAQTTTTNTLFLTPLRVQVTETAFNRPLPGVPVTFILPESGASALANTLTVFTNNQGIAELNLQANGLAGEYVAIARLTPQITLPFTLTNIPVPIPPIPPTPPIPPIPPLHDIDRSFLNRSLERLDDNISLEEDALFTLLETSISDTFADHLGTTSPSISREEAQQALRDAEMATGSRTAVIYAFFRPPGELAAADGTIRDFEAGLTANRRNLIQSALRGGEPTDELELIMVTAYGRQIQRRVPNAIRADVVAMVSQLRRNVSRPDSATYFLAAQQLYNWLIAPLEPELTTNNIDHLAFIVDAGLRSAPLAALHDGEQFVIERYSLGILPSLSLTDLGYRSLDGATVLATGAEQFTTQDALPAVPLEIDVIAQQLWSGSTLLNEEFRITNFTAQQAESPARIVHLATHGEFQPGALENSYIQFWDERLTIDRLHELGLNLSLVDLLVLSACRTALGDRQAELGFAGLAVAAGVKTAMGSLWYVSDEGTLALMSDFYAQLMQTSTKAEALQQAQQALLRGEVRVVGDELITAHQRLPLPPALQGMGDRDFTHPYFWSAFTLIGNPW